MYYEVGFSRVIIDKQGKEVKSSNKFMINTLTFSDAELKACKELVSMSVKHPEINTISKTNVCDCISGETPHDDKWYKIKIVDFDDSGSKPKKVQTVVLVEAVDNATANDYAAGWYNSLSGEWFIKSTELTDVLTVLD